MARGPFHGFVDQGPYDHSWGGPGRAGAWLAHFAISVPCSLAAIAALYGVASLHRRLTAPPDGSAPMAAPLRRRIRTRTNDGGRTFPVEGPAAVARSPTGRS
ncbi:hypothetical protein [Streptomyces sp. NPDC057287]|uniref:hypothetical protein n=1 Tax=Streptomyces sp. NPDC057287 TaxID=3346086 RepID=UPI00363D1FCE